LSSEPFAALPECCAVFDAEETDCFSNVMTAAVVLSLTDHFPDKSLIALTALSFAEASSFLGPPPFP